MLPRCPMPSARAGLVLPLHPLLLKLSTVSGKAQRVLWGYSWTLMDSTAGQGVRGSHSSPKEKSKFLSIDPEIGSVYPNPAPVLRKKKFLFF